MNAEPLFNRPVRYPHGGKTGYLCGHGVKPETEVMLSFSIPGPIISRILLTQTPVYTVISILYQQKQLVFHESGSCYGSPLLLVAVAFVVSDFNGMYLYRSPYMGKSTFS